MNKSELISHLLLNVFDFFWHIEDMVLQDNKTGMWEINHGLLLICDTIKYHQMKKQKQVLQP